MRTNAFPAGTSVEGYGYLISNLSTAANIEAAAKNDDVGFKAFENWF